MEMFTDSFEIELDQHIEQLEAEVEFEQEFKRDVYADMHHLECELSLPELNFN